MNFVDDRKKLMQSVIKGINICEPNDYINIDGLNSYCLHRRDVENDKVQIIVSGGGGYGPLFPGFVGKGLADGMVHGELDCAPNAYAIYELVKRINRGKGVLLLTNNYMGDYLNNDMAIELLGNEGFDAKVVYVSDDVMSSKDELKENRGGLSGIGIITKVAAAGAAEGSDLDAVYRIAQKANDNLRSIAVTMDESTGNIEYGRGFSGEEAVYTYKYSGSFTAMRSAIEFLINDYVSKPSEVCLCCNRLRYTTYAEGHILLCDADEVLRKMNIGVYSASCGCYLDAFNKSGAIINVLKLDDELKKYVTSVRGYDFTI